MQLTLTVLRCPDSVAPETRTIQGGELTAGRGPGVDWVLPDAEQVVSKRHFTIAFRAGAWQIEDQSTNGTTLNRDAGPLGRGHTHVLKDGDRIRVGPYEIEARLAEAPAAYGGYGGYTPQEADPFPPARGLDPYAPAGGESPFAEPSLPGGLGGHDAFPLPDFDPLAAVGSDSGYGAPFRGPAQSDHSSVLNDSFRPAAEAGQMPAGGGIIPAGNLLPDDLDDLLAGIAPATPGAAPPAPPPAAEAWRPNAPQSPQAAAPAENAWPSGGAGGQEPAAEAWPAAVPHEGRPPATPTPQPPGHAEAWPPAAPAPQAAVPAETWPPAPSVAPPPAANGAEAWPPAAAGAPSAAPSLPQEQAWPSAAELPGVVAPAHAGVSPMAGNPMRQPAAPAADASWPAPQAAPGAGSPPTARGRVEIVDDEPSPFDEPFDTPPPKPVPVSQVAPPAAARQAAVPPVAARPPVDAPPPAPAAAAPPPRVAAAPPATADDTVLLAAFLEGVGLSDLHPTDPALMMRRLGESFRTFVSGLRAVLIARDEVRSEFRIEQTIYRSKARNPLQMSADDDDAITALLGVGRRTSMTPADAVRDALRKIELHELASMTAMQTALRTLMAGLSPDKLRAAAEQGGGMSVLPAQRKARAWDAYEATYTRTVQALSDDFDSVFGKAFARAYEEALEDLSAKGNA